MSSVSVIPEAAAVDPVMDANCGRLVSSMRMMLAAFNAHDFPEVVHLGESDILLNPALIHDGTIHFSVRRMLYHARMHLREHAQALVHADMAARLAVCAYGPDSTLHVISEIHLADCHSALKNVPAALAAVREARRSCVRDQEIYGKACIRMGDLMVEDDPSKIKDALKIFMDGEDALRMHGHTLTNTYALLCNNLGTILSKCGRPRSALDWHKRGMLFAKEDETLHASIRANVVLMSDFNKCCGGCDADNPTKRCAVCKSIFYCDQKCQRRDYPQHKILCEAKK